MNKKAFEFKNKYVGICIILLFGFLFFLGLFVTKDYGIHCDQQSELDILYSNIIEYNENIFLGNEKIKSLCSTYEEIEGREVLPISESIERDHGVAPYYIIAPLLLINQNDPIKVVQIQHHYNFIIFFICILAVYYLAKKMTGSKVMGAGVATLLYATPRFFAEAHYNNKDILLFAMFVITIACGYRFIEKKNILNLLLFSFAAALCANIKIIGILPFGIIIAIYLIEVFKNKKERKKGFLFLAVAIFAFVGILVILTPAIWDGPISYYKYLVYNAVHFSRWDNKILFDGVVYRQSVTGLPRRYILEEYFITTPVFISVFWLTGASFMLIDFLKNPKSILGKKENSIPFVLIAMQVCFFGYAVLSNMTIYNGWRHLYFTYIGTIMAIIYFGKKIINSRYIKISRVMMVIGVICIIGTICSGIRNHPYQYTYFNILAGEDISEKYEIDYWCVSTYNAILALQEIEESGEVTITSLETVTWSQLKEAIKLLPEEGTKITIEKKDDGWVNAQYILDNPMYSKIYYSNEYKYIGEEYDLVVEIKAYGNEVIRIYEKKKE